MHILYNNLLYILLCYQSTHVNIFFGNFKTTVYKNKDYDAVFAMQKLYIGMAFKGTCRYFFDKLAMSDEKCTYKHKLSAKKTKLLMLLQSLSIALLLRYDCLIKCKH